MKSGQTTVFDPLDRTTQESTQVGTGPVKTTTFTHLGMSDQIISEEQPDAGGAAKTTATYTYGPGGERISQTKSPLAGGASETSYYGVNPHTDVETLTSESGNTRSTYRYTGYGENDGAGFSGKDKVTATGGPEVEADNPYRFNSKRWDPATGGYDMGFRDYSPGLNRFLTRDMYNGALSDLRLGSDPWTGNRYAFAGGNPVTGIEFDGHYTIDEKGERTPGSTGYMQIWNARHDTAADATADGARSSHPERGTRVTTERKDNSIAGGSFVNPGDQNGYADVIQWGPETTDEKPRVVYIWEVKHGGGAAEDEGKDQVDNYVRYLQTQLGAKFRVRPGYELARRMRPNRLNFSELITVESKREEPGVELYDFGESDPYSVQLRMRRPAVEEPEERPHTMPAPDPGVVAQVGAGLAFVGYLAWKGTPWGIAAN